VLSIISLITGILSVVSSFFYVGFLFGLAGVILGFLGRRKEPAAKGLWLTGIITGFVGIAVTVIWTIFIIIVLAAVHSSNLGN
jgi:hypothetical protein